jgi:formylmethanofuran dehydrogenase subunit A
VFQTTDILQWIATHVDFKRLTVVSDEGKIVRSLEPSNLHNMYRLKQVEAKCNKEYLDSFNVKFSKSYKLMKDWYREEESFKDRANITKYSPKEFNSPHSS